MRPGCFQPEKLAVSIEPCRCKVLVADSHNGGNEDFTVLL